VRILFCSLEAPLPPVNGFRLHLEGLLRELRKVHEVRLIGFRYADQRGVGLADASCRLLPLPSTGLAGKARDLPWAMLVHRPLGVDRLARRLRPLLREAIGNFHPDVVHVTPGELALLARDLESWATVLVPTDAWHLNVQADRRVSTGLRRLMLPWQERWIRRFEGRHFRRFGAVVVVSEGDRDALLSQDPTLRIEVIPNGVDAGRFSPDASAEPHPNRIVFTGVMSYPPNVSAAEYLAREVLPLVRAARPGARLAIVGRNPHPRVSLLGASLEGVDVVGEVPDMVPWLRSGRVYACPMVSGTGIKNKLLEAMATGLPCVATPLALRGIKAAHGRHVLVAEDAVSFARYLVRVLKDDALAGSLGRAARSYITAEHSWAAVGDAFERVYEEVRAGFSNR
jgi:glycosyltransferase involved in cell wall biosynthesis